MDWHRICKKGLDRGDAARYTLLQYLESDEQEK
jgi:hypothetical protein